MKRIIEVLRSCDIECYPNERFSLGVEMFPENIVEYNFPQSVLFEEPVLKEGKKVVTDKGTSIFRYFLDGSLRSYRVIDVSLKNRYLPICAGQIGVALTERNDDGRLSINREFTAIENLLAIPDLIEDYNVKDLEDKINEKIDSRFKFRIVKYQFNAKEDSDPADKGRAIIIHEMQMLELKTIKKMIRNNLIHSHHMLAKDGGLQYRESKIKNLNFDSDDIIQLRNVIGLAKTFSPNLNIGHGRKRKDIGNLTKNLEWRERTTVISPNRDESNTHGWWYLRLRPKSKVYSPLQGIIKIEVFVASDEKVEGGISSSRADTISSYVLRERNVTPYNTDSRWASHIYPIYLAEKYLKSSFLSHNRFKALIF